MSSAVKTETDHEPKDLSSPVNGTFIQQENKEQPEPTQLNQPSTDPGLKPEFKAGEEINYRSVQKI